MPVFQWWKLHSGTKNLCWLWLKRGPLRCGSSGLRFRSCAFLWSAPNRFFTIPVPWSCHHRGPCCWIAAFGVAVAGVNYSLTLWWHSILDRIANFFPLLPATPQNTHSSLSSSCACCGRPQWRWGSYSCSRRCCAVFYWQSSRHPTIFLLSCKAALHFWRDRGKVILVPQCPNWKDISGLSSASRGWRRVGCFWLTFSLPIRPKTASYSLRVSYCWRICSLRVSLGSWICRGTSLCSLVQCACYLRVAPRFGPDRKERVSFRRIRIFGWGYEIFENLVLGFTFGAVQ